MIKNQLSKLYTNLKKVSADYKKGKLLIHNYIWLNLNADDKKTIQKHLKSKKIKITKKQIIKKLLFIVWIKFQC